MIDVLDALGVQSAHVVGIGAWMATELAAISPSRVRKLVLVNPQGIWLEKAPGEDPFAQHPGQPSEVLFSNPSMRQRFLFEGKEKLDAHVEELLDLRAAASSSGRPGDRREPPAAAHPRATLVATSEKDAIVPAAHGPAWRDLIPGAELVAIRGAGHLVELEQPERFTALVKDFLLRHRAVAVA
jgi:pimeloyl-ACP methyl ester carboxylesterase